MRKMIATAALLMALAAPAVAQAPPGPEEVTIKFDAVRLNLVVEAINNGLVKSKADPLLQFLQGQINAQIADWQKAQAPESKPAPFPEVPKPAPLPPAAPKK